MNKMDTIAYQQRELARMFREGQHHANKIKVIEQKIDMILEYLEVEVQDFHSKLVDK